MVRLIRGFFRLFGNRIKSFSKGPDHITFVLDGSYLDLKPAKSNVIEKFTSRNKQSLQELSEQFDAVLFDPRVKGVILHIRNTLTLTIAQAQHLRDLISKLRSGGKHVVAWSYGLGTGTYFIASAADEVVLQEGGWVSPLGSRLAGVFLADALAKAGIEADFVAISPYKSAADSLTRNSMSREMKEMETWLVDSVFEEIVSGVAEGRKITVEQARTLIDSSPYTDVKALEAGVIDQVMAEEGLPKHLGLSDKNARIVPWEKAKKQLMKAGKKRSRKYIALIRVEGTIVDGKSGNPPMPLPVPLIGGARAGDLTVVQQIRKATSDKRAGAIILHIDSPGGSATSSEAMAAALDTAATKKPVVAYMSSVAASGGYYVATPANWIVAEPSTITGSIGVLSGKIVTSGLWTKLSVNREGIERGKNVSMMLPEKKFTKSQRQLVEEGIVRTYEIFVARAAKCRAKTTEEIDKVAAGRVWTGRQALQHGLIDQIGSIDSAAQKARELANLPAKTRVKEITVKKANLGPQAPSAAAAITYLLDGAKSLNRAHALALLPLLEIEQLSER